MTYDKRNILQLYCSLPKGPRGLLFREYLPAMGPLLNVLREIAKQRRKTVPQVKRIL
jgi:hypothetical protein